MTDLWPAICRTLTVPCPDCQGYDASLRSQGLTHDPTTGRPLCDRCDKDGTVHPLLKACDTLHHADQRYLPDGFTPDPDSCPDCSGTGLVHVPFDALALLAAMADAGYAHGHDGREWWFAHNSSGAEGISLTDPDAPRHGTADPDAIRDALLRAASKALGCWDA